MARFIATAVAACLAAYANTASAQVAVDSRGEQVITYPNSVRPPVHRTEVYRWLCVDPVEITVVSTLRENRALEVATVTGTIANIPVARQYMEELTELAGKRLFRIYGLCNGDRPIAMVNYTDPPADPDNDTGETTIRSQRIYLRDEAPPQ